MLIHARPSRPAPPASAFLSALLLGAVTLAAGCSSYESPTMAVSDARVTDRTGEGLALAFTVDAANPNTDALPLRDASYSLELDGKRVFSGHRSAEATLRRRGTQQFVLPAGVPDTLLAQLPAGTQSVRYRIHGSVEYIIPGAFAEVLFDTGVRRPSASFSDEGTIDLSAAPSSPPPLVPLHVPRAPAPRPAPAPPAAPQAAPTPASTPQQ